MIKNSKVKAYLFPPERKNRLMNSWEQQEEREIAKIFCRPQRKYIFDNPTYTFFPPAPKVPKINFDLNYVDK